ncbi:MAG: MXAN_2562 family outer membrane beta-barrel protein [Deltaproteobacteria bacterium]
MAFELRFGPYAPRIDEGTDTPIREQIFGDKTRYQFGFEIDGQLWRAPHVGTLGVGLGWSYTRLSGLNLPENAPDAPILDAKITQKSSLNIMPLYVVGVLRVDVLAKELHVPLVGYGKFGLGYALWWVNDGLGTARACDANGENCTRGRDTSVGTQAALGAMFLLDWLQPSSGAELDNAMGINNSYLFLEWSVSNFGGDQMNVGTNTWVTGLAVEM